MSKDPVSYATKMNAAARCLAEFLARKLEALIQKCVFDSPTASVSYNVFERPTPVHEIPYVCVNERDLTCETIMATEIPEVEGHCVVKAFKLLQQETTREIVMATLTEKLTRSVDIQIMSYYSHVTPEGLCFMITVPCAR